MKFYVAFYCSHGGHKQDETLDESWACWRTPWCWGILGLSSGNLASCRKVSLSNSDRLLMVYLPLSLLETPSQQVSLCWPVRLMRQWQNIASSSLLLPKYQRWHRCVSFGLKWLFATSSLSWAWSSHYRGLKSVTIAACIFSIPLSTIYFQDTPSPHHT